MDAGITAINDRVREGSAFAYRLREEIATVIVGQRYLVDRLLIGLLAERPRAARRRARPGQDAVGQDARRRPSTATFHRIQFTPDLLPADLIGTLIYNPRDGVVHRQARADLRQPHPRRRDQPRPRQGAERAARGDAGAPGHDRRRDLPAARSVPGAGHAEPDRAGRHLSAARGAGRSLHAEAHDRLPDARGGAADPRPHGDERDHRAGRRPS